MAGFIRSAPAAGVIVPAHLPYEWSWAGDVLAAGDWSTEWTDRGLDLRYCEHFLLVFVDRADLMEVDQRTVQSSGRLKWLRGGVTGGMSHVSVNVTLPASMGTLSARRVALAGRVVDPFGRDVTRRRKIVDGWRLACPPQGKPNETLGYRQLA